MQSEYIKYNLIYTREKIFYNVRTGTEIARKTILKQGG